MLMNINEAKQKIEDGKILFIAGEESLLDQLPKGKWIAGTIPYFMDDDGGIITKEKIFATEVPKCLVSASIKLYSEDNLSQIPSDAPENGFSIIIIPATSKVHISYAQNAPNYPNIFLKPIIGWISGVHLDDLGKISPKVYNGETNEKTDQKAVVMHLGLPENKMATIGIINLFKQGDGDEITFDEEGFSINDCYINGNKQNFAEYLLTNNINIQLPLVADYYGVMVNVSFQAIKEEKTVDLYAPVFKGIKYKIAAPVDDYVKQFNDLIPKGTEDPAFSCNCILNFLYSELEGKKVEKFIGPITFGEIAYQLLNQTMTYLEVKDL